MKIITIYDQEHAKCLHQKADYVKITPDGLLEAKEIGEKLIKTLEPLMPAAGLAAPQIGISKQVFIYSWNRTIENLEIAINPIIISSNSDKVFKWEACFSTIKDGEIKAAKVERSNDITVEYLKLDGKLIRKRLQGFAAKLFQHEYDHLQGINNVSKQGTEVKTFDNMEEFQAFMHDVKQKDSINYIEPIIIENERCL